MSRYKIKFIPAGAIPQDTDLGIHLQKAGAAETSTTEGVGPPFCGACGGIDAPDGTFVNPTGVTVLTFFPIALDLGPWDSSTDYELLPGHNDAGELVDVVHWYMRQTGGPTRTPTGTPLGASIQDGISFTFDDTTDGGSYDGTQFILTMSRPDPWYGEVPGNRSFGCDTLILESFETTPEVDLTLTSGFDWSSSSYFPYVGHYGFEAPDPWTVVFEATGFPSGTVVWEYDVPVDPAWSYTPIEGSTTLTLIFFYVGGSNPDVLKFRAVDSGDSMITAPPVPPDDDGWVYITQS